MYWSEIFPTRAQAYSHSFVQEICVSTFPKHGKACRNGIWNGSQLQAWCQA